MKHPVKGLAKDLSHLPRPASAASAPLIQMSFAGEMDEFFLSGLSLGLQLPSIDDLIVVMSALVD